jgi:hypothetical protein
MSGKPASSVVDVKEHQFVDTGCEHGPIFFIWLGLPINGPVIMVNATVISPFVIKGKKVLAAMGIFGDKRFIGEMG